MKKEGLKKRLQESPCIIENILERASDNKIADTEKAREFVSDVLKLAKSYNLSVFVVTEGASGTMNNNCDAVRNARDSHIKWEKKNGHDPYEDWSKK